MPDHPNALHYLAGPGHPEPASSFPPGEREVLEAINLKVAGQATLDDLMAFLFEAVQALYPCDRLSLAFLEEDGRRLQAHWAKATYEGLHLLPGYTEDLTGSSLSQVLSSGCARLLYDLPGYAQAHPRSRSTRLLVAEGVRSSLTCPLLLGDRPFGVIFLSSRQPRAYTPYHVRHWRAVAERIGQAVEKAWRIEQLTTANRAYQEVLAFVSHELKHPVASMITDAQVLAGGYLGPLEPPQVQKLERLMAKGRDLLDLVSHYLDLARMEGGQLILAPRQADLLREILEPALDVIQPQQRARGMSLVTDLPPGPCDLVCDPGLLRIVMVNLLGNAITHGCAGGQIRLSCHRDPEGLQVQVWNEGKGFSPEDRTRLFRKFSRLSGAQDRKGSGLGLYTAWRLVHLHGGRMDAHSEPGAWAEFSFSIPQPLPPPSPVR